MPQKRREGIPLNFLKTFGWETVLEEAELLELGHYTQHERNSFSLSCPFCGHHLCMMKTLADGEFFCYGPRTCGREGTFYTFIREYYKYTAREARRFFFRLERQYPERMHIGRTP